MTINADGTITYQPDSNYIGTDVFVYQICDDDGACDSATVTISVADVNDAPIANDDADSTPEDTPVTTPVLANDFDTDGTLDVTSVTIITAPSNGSTTVNADGSITYEPDSNYFGIDTYVYQVCDDDGACDQATVTITISDLNDAPIANDDSDSTPEDTPVTTDVLDNDLDTDGTLDISSVTIITAPSNGSVTVNIDGSITYEPDSNYIGTDTYVYQVCDDDGACDSATVTISVADVNDAPIAVDDSRLYTRGHSGDDSGAGQ